MDQSRTLTVLLESAVGEVDPRFALSAHGAKVSRLIFDGLVSVDNVASEPELVLAEEVERLDEITYRFRLREGLVFHDGHPLTSADVVYTYQSVMDPVLSSPLSGMFDKLASVEATDPLTVVFRLYVPHAPTLTDLTLGIVPRHVLEPAGGRFPDLPIGSGPFKLLEQRGEERVILGRNSRHHATVPKLERVVLHTIRDENSRVLSLLGGSGDLLQNAVSPLLLPMLERRPGVTVRTSQSVAYSYMVLNLRDPILSNLKVRKAIAHAIDREGIVASKLGGRAVLSTGMLAPGHWAYTDEVPRYPYDPEEARRLLDAAGFPMPSSGNGPRFTLTLKTSTDRLRRSVARVFAHNLRQVGIELEVQAYEFSTFFHDVRSGNFQLATLQWPSVQEPDLYNWIFHSSMIPTEDNRGRGANRGAYVNERLDRLIERGRQVFEREERRAVYVEIQQILAQDLPYISLWHDDNVAVLREDVLDYRILPNARFGTLVDVIRATD